MQVREWFRVLPCTQGEKSMNRSVWFAAVLGGAIVAASALAGDIKSGPEVGKSIPGPFSPLHCNGPTEDQKVCLV